MIRNMMGTVKEVSNFFNYSPKRQGVLDEKIAELCPESKVRKIKDVCRTRYDDQYTLQSFSFYNGNIRQFRWVERLDA